MMGNLILYLICILLTAYLNLMYEITYGAALIACELTLFICCFLQAFYLKHTVSVRITSASSVLTRKEALPVDIYICNRSRLLAPAVWLALSCRYNGTVQKRTRWRLPAQSRATTVHTLRLSADMCGKIIISPESVKVCDYFRLFRLKAGTAGFCELTVLPAIHDINVEILEETRMYPGDGCEYSHCQSGDDPSEIFGIREYRPGDRLQRIHWKLSARNDELYVKEYSLPVTASVMLFLEGGDSPFNGSTAQAYIETAVSLSCALFTQGCSHYVTWLTKEQYISKTIVSDEEAFHKLTADILMLTEHPPLSGVEDTFCHIFPGESWLRTLTLYPDLKLLLDGKLVAQINPEDIKGSLSKAILFI